MPPASVGDSGQLPLEDVTVLDLTQIAAGPFATMILGDLGADIIKVEAVGRGDRSRSSQPSPEFFDSLNRNKRSIAIDLKSEEGQSVATELAKEADVFIENMKAGRVERFNLAYDDIVEVNEDIIYCSVTGFGSGSPYEDVPAFDMLIQAMSGIMSMTGEADGPPLWSGLPSGDVAAALYAAQSILVALYAKERGQIQSEWIEVPMLDVAISLIGLRIAYTFGNDEPFPRQGNTHPSAAPFGTFECQDGMILIAAGTDSLWANLCNAMGREDLLDDDRFTDTEARIEHRSALHEEINGELAKDSSDVWIEKLQSNQVPAGPIHDTKSLLNDEHVERKNLHRIMEREGRDDADVIDNPIHFQNLSTVLASAPEDLGEGTEQVMRQHGYSGEEIAELRKKGVIE